MLNIFLLNYSTKAKPTYVNEDFLLSILIPSQETVFAKELLDRLYALKFDNSMVILDSPF